MSEGNLVVVVGHICREDPVLRFINSGKAVAEFTIRVPGTRAKGDQPATEATFKDVVCWEALVENVAESLRQGDRVIVRGVEKLDTWQSKDGEEKTREKITAWNVGPDLSFATATVVRTERQEPAKSTTASGYKDF